MILAGDVGGTKTTLALFARQGTRPELVVQKSFPSQEYESLEQVVKRFLDENSTAISSACFGVAGPVQHKRSKVTNLPWIIDAHRLRTELAFPWVGLINDLEANAYGLAVLDTEDFAILNQGTKEVEGNSAMISAGTGLGEAVLYWDGQNHIPFASEGGHCSFAPYNEVDAELWRYLYKRFGHVSYERVLSGPGLRNIYNFLKESGYATEPAWLAEQIEQKGNPAISEAALGHRCDLAVRALDMFATFYGAEAGNLALKVMATGGVYVGGGIAPKILPKLQDGTFMKAFVNKGRLQPILEGIPVWVILNDKAALLGAAEYAYVHGEKQT